MSQPLELTCPICRAKQQAQATCRRCAGDLTLYLKACYSSATAQQLYSDALSTGNQGLAQRAQQYLCWVGQPPRVLRREG